jgi:L,D-transpeptidase catalytic domain
MRLPRLVLLAAALALAPAASASAAILVSIDKSAQQMIVSVDGETRYTWPVSTGRPGYDTPNGAYSTLWMDREHYSREWDDAPMPYSIFFTKKGHAIHGTYHRSLGQPVSHGCVRLSVKNAAALWALVKQHGRANTTVVLTGETPDTGTAVARREDAQPIPDDDGPPPGWRRYGYRDSPRYYYRPYYPPRRYYRYGGFPFFPYGR